MSNLTDKPQTLHVNLNTEGQLSLLGDATQNLTLSPGQRSTLQVPVKALGGYGTGVVKVTVNGLDLPGETLAPFTREWTLGVRPAYPALLVVC